MLTTTPPLTHPETAWLLHAVTPALATAAAMLAGTLLRPRLSALIVTARGRHARAALAALPPEHRPDVALLWAPALMPAAALALVSICAAAAVALALSLVAHITLALALGAPVAALVIWGADRISAHRYDAHLDRDLTPVVGRLAALLRAGISLRPAIERIVGDLPPGPLCDEWTFLIARQGAPLAGGGIATPQQVVSALADQTPSRRHGAFLNHLGASVGQPQDLLARRCEAAYAALQVSERRRDEAATELAQMRYSGMAVGLAGMAMAAYLASTQWERVVQAYSTPLGAAVGIVVLCSLCLPIIGGMLLTHVDDSDY